MSFLFMKNYSIYSSVLILFVAIFIAGCSKTVQPSSTIVTTNNQGDQEYTHVGNTQTTTDTQTTLPVDNTNTQTTTDTISGTSTETTTTSGISLSNLA